MTTPVNMKVLEWYFTQGNDAREFLNELREVMADYADLAKQSERGMDEERSSHMEFLDDFCQFVQESVKY